MYLRVLCTLALLYARLISATWYTELYCPTRFTNYRTLGRTCYSHAATGRVRLLLQISLLNEDVHSVLTSTIVTIMSGQDFRSQRTTMPLKIYLMDPVAVGRHRPNGSRATQVNGLSKLLSEVSANGHDKASSSHRVNLPRLG